MTAKVLYFPKDKIMKNKIDPKLFRLMFKHRKLIASAKERGYSDLAIYKLVVSAEASKKS